jgi:hypothetical protein
LPVVVDTSESWDRVYDKSVSRLLFLHVHREASAVTNELLEESDQLRFLRAPSLPNLQESVGLILAKTSTMRISRFVISPVYINIPLRVSFVLGVPHHY